MGTHTSSRLLGVEDMRREDSLKHCKIRFLNIGYRLPPPNYGVGVVRGSKDDLIDVMMT